MTAPKKPNNLKTGLIVAAAAVLFFVGIFINRMWFA